MDAPSSFLHPCQRFQALLEWQWEHTEPFSSSDQAFYQEHRDSCPVCVMEAKEQEALMASLKDLPPVELADDRAEKMMDQVMAFLETAPEAVAPAQRPASFQNRVSPVWGWAVAACILIMAVSGYRLISPDGTVRPVAQVPTHAESAKPSIESETTAVEAVTAGHQVALAQPATQPAIQSKVKSGTSGKHPVKRTIKRSNRRPPILHAVVADASGIEKQGPTMSSRHVQAAASSAVDGELLADASMVEDPFWGTGPSVAMAARSGISQQANSQAALQQAEQRDELAVDTDQQWSASGEVSLVDFVGF